MGLIDQVGSCACILNEPRVVPEPQVAKPCSGLYRHVLSDINGLDVSWHAENCACINICVLV